MIVPGEAMAKAGTYRLLLRLRPEMVDWMAFAPIRQPLPEAAAMVGQVSANGGQDVTLSTCQ